MMKIQSLIEYNKDEYTTVLCGYRQSGRTTKLLKLAKESSLRGHVTYVLCSNLMQAKAINKRLDVQQPLSENRVYMDGKVFFYQIYLPTKIKFNKRVLFVDDIEYIGPGRSHLDIDEKAHCLRREYNANHITFTVEG